ncbi:SHOCT domain-containing protein [Nocardioides sp. W7]|uniref:SHOCT domain-containing protein n=1 Tax=Nocardioides sp. W7 TaxID=2931390 RepID=UPI001FD2C0A1|nr:SHOCT domain-containing protein [Nocardioides sp. W7]
MRRAAASRRGHVGILRRPPTLDAKASGAASSPPSVRRTDQVRQLLRLVDRGVLSDEEFERQVLKVFGTSF